MNGPAGKERAVDGSATNSIAQIFAKPHALLVYPDNIPTELKEREQWVNWQYQWNDKQKKWTKPPLDSNAALKGALKKASSINPETWSSYENALAAYRMHPPMKGEVLPPDDGSTGNSGIDGIGFVLTPKDGICGLDIDNCFTDDGQLNATAQHIVNALQSYTEFSPSGKGLRLWCFAKKPHGRSKNGDIEVYDGVTQKGKQGGRYLTVTGNLF